MLLGLAAIPTFAQNLQLHYDFGDARKYYTATFEMFKPDNYGSNFFFIDFDFNASNHNKTTSTAYFEISRYVTVYDKLDVTLQYNDGIATGEETISNITNKAWYQLGSIWLGGVSYPIDLGFVTIKTDLMYRSSRDDNNEPNAQATFVWFKPFLDGKLTFSGFLDVWTANKKDNNYQVTDDKKVVFLTEPQLWYNVWENLNLGGEVEISNNFLPGENDVVVNPTLGFKWNF